MTKKKHPAPTSPVATRALTVIGALALGLLVLDFVIHRHTYFDLEATHIFYPIFGILAFLVGVGGGLALRFILTRAPDYYGDNDNA